MRCLVEGFPEQPEEVIAGKAGFLGNLIEAERMIVAVIDKITRAIEPLERFEVGFQSLGSFSSLFHRCVGHAPVTYRERAQAKRQIPGCFLVMHKLESA